MAARTTPDGLNVDDLLADARQQLTDALAAARDDLHRREEELAPLRERIRELEAALARVTGGPAGSTHARSELTDEEKERRRQRRAERRAARKAVDVPATA